MEQTLAEASTRYRSFRLAHPQRKGQGCFTLLLRGNLDGLW
jgi:hypothetical protein